MEPADTIAAGLEHHRAGRHDQAESAYRAALAMAPGLPDAVYLLAVIAHQRGRHAEAADALAPIVAASPDQAGPRQHLGEALAALGRHGEAAEYFTAALGINTITVIGSSGAAAALTSISSAITLAASKLGGLGSSSKAVSIQNDFTSKFIDILTEGIGTMIDADLAKESANLTSLQIKQQLGTQALSIANARPQSLLRLFQ